MTDANESPKKTESDNNAPVIQDLQAKLKTSRILNIVFAAVAVFLGLVVLAQSLNSPGVTAPTADPGANNNSTQTPDATASTTAPEYVELEFVRRKADDPMAIGSVDAPIVLAEWTDFRCPYCALYVKDTMPAIVQEYIDSGLVRYEIHDVAFFGDQSIDAAVAVRAAGEQGRYFEYMNALYQAAPERGHAELTKEKLMEFASQIGIPDLAKFETDLADTGIRNAVVESTAHAQQLGVKSVPFFVLGKEALAGAQPIEVFREFIDNSLTQAGK